MDGYLIHHGVKGQRWGIRRYQNPDGTLTDTGRKRLGSFARSNYIKRVTKNEKRAEIENRRRSGERISRIQEYKEVNQAGKDARQKFVDAYKNEVEKDKMSEGLKKAAIVTAVASVVTDLARRGVLASTLSDDNPDVVLGGALIAGTLNTIGRLTTKAAIASTSGYLVRQAYLDHEGR